MPAYDKVKSRIEAFAGYDTEDARRRSDEQIRAFVGECLANVPADALDLLDAELRAQYDRALLRCEFFNQQAFGIFESATTPERIEAVVAADLQLLDAAGMLDDEAAITAALLEIERAFGERDAAMQA